MKALRIASLALFALALSCGDDPAGGKNNGGGPNNGSNNGPGPGNNDNNGASNNVVPQTDTDGDGLADANETTLGTDPNNPDSDGDGLSDGEEVSAGSNPLNTDTDGDGALDGSEVIAGSDPTVVDEACGLERYTASLEEKPVDIIVVIDNSGSMTAEIQGVEKNINDNFAQIIAPLLG